MKSPGSAPARHSRLPRSDLLTANELLALLGRAWPRLLIYPGGLTAFALIWLIGRIKNREPRAEHQYSSASPRFAFSGSWGRISAIALPWLGLALLPLPYVAGISRQTDLTVVLALLEWPLVLTIATELWDADAGVQLRAVRRLAAALNSYPPLILATLVLMLGAGSFDTTALARPLDDSAPASAVLLHWIGAVAWPLALPPALGIGSFAAGLPERGTLRIGLRLRTLGLVALAALPWFPLVGGDTLGNQGGTILTFAWLPLPPLVIGALLWSYDRLTAGHSANHWARAYLAFDGALLLLLLWAAYIALQARLA
jgi:hypothetical protein